MLTRNHGDDASRAPQQTMLPLVIEQTDTTRLSTFSGRGTRLPPTSDRPRSCPRLPAAHDPLAAGRARGPEAPTPQK